MCRAWSGAPAGRGLVAEAERLHIIACCGGELESWVMMGSWHLVVEGPCSRETAVSSGDAMRLRWASGALGTSIHQCLAFPRHHQLSDCHATSDPVVLGLQRVAKCRR